MLIFVLLVIYAASGVYRIIRYIRNAHIKTDGLFTGMPIPAARDHDELYAGLSAH